MSNQRYPEEFKIEAVKQVTERGLRVADVAERPPERLSGAVADAQAQVPGAS